EIVAPADDDTRAKWAAVKDEVVGIVGPSNLEGVNCAVNRWVKYQPDNSGDVWNRPTVTVRCQVGDCEDFAILKRSILLNLGFSSSKMALVIGSIFGQDHAFLVVNTDEGFRVLDNRFDEVIDPAEYANLVPKKLLKDDDVFLYSKMFTLKEVTA